MSAQNRTGEPVVTSDPNVRCRTLLERDAAGSWRSQPRAPKKAGEIDRPSRSKSDSCSGLRFGSGGDQLALIADAVIASVVRPLSAGSTHAASPTVIGVVDALHTDIVSSGVCANLVTLAHVQGDYVQNPCTTSALDTEFVTPAIEEPEYRPDCVFPDCVEGERPDFCGDCALQDSRVSWDDGDDK